LKENGEIEELLYAFYTCNKEEIGDPLYYIEYGGWSENAAGIERQVRQIQTKDKSTWAIYL